MLNCLSHSVQMLQIGQLDQFSNSLIIIYGNPNSIFSLKIRSCSMQLYCVKVEDEKFCTITTILKQTPFLCEITAYCSSERSGVSEGIA
ncbi:hypothetical protein LAZ67_4003468 [Cordylochernes scorpioides]|uniref:Uncharacterized protein n=1 Tax=Cordylochernes scorpioides TaxID=51811 RepID=A0ABY6KDW0_9ARAC|nr:hypothetical protein LAZ67_4003468 [Cordylochernes scorpioides]